MRKFETGATRDSDAGKIDNEGFLSPSVLRELGVYITKHGIQADGKVRESDNWMKGIPLKEYMKSLLRHAMEQPQVHHVPQERLHVLLERDALHPVIRFSNLPVRLYAMLSHE